MKLFLSKPLVAMKKVLPQNIQLRAQGANYEKNM
jgi:hypothetical protein